MREAASAVCRAAPVAGAVPVSRREGELPRLGAWQGLVVVVVGEECSAKVPPDLSGVTVTSGADWPTADAARPVGEDEGQTREVKDSGEVAVCVYGRGRVLVCSSESEEDMVCFSSSSCASSSRSSYLSPKRR